MGIDLHIIDVLKGSTLAQQDRLLLGLVPSISVPATADFIGSLTTVTAGTGYTTLPTFADTSNSPSLGATAVATSLKAITATVVTPGSGVQISDTLTLVGGNAGKTASVFNITHALLVSVALTGGGAGTSAGYVQGDVLTLNNGSGTFTTHPTVTVDTVDAGGGITSWHLSNSGDCTGTLQTTFTTTDSPANGTGATFGSGLWGAKTLTVNNAGVYTSIPTLPNAATPSASGVGTTVNVSFGVNAASLTASGGPGYSGPGAPTLTSVGGGGTGATVVSVLSTTGDAFLYPVAMSLPAKFSVLYGLSQASAYASTKLKAATGFTVVVTPLAGASLVAGTADAVVLA